MRLSSTLALTTATFSAAQSAFQSSSKRGLIFVPSKKSKLQYDDQVWVEGSSDLTWYYNYQVQPSTAYANRTQAEFDYPNVTQWITEYALSNQPLAATQDFFKMSAEYLDRVASVSRYSYFGSFRSDRRD
ncbi:F5/8 type C domain protein [Diplocarpon rosae]|nr:F5/8 type C domain protein [Diplocarpon rosae]